MRCVKYAAPFLPKKRPLVEVCAISSRILHRLHLPLGFQTISLGVSWHGAAGAKGMPRFRQAGSDRHATGPTVLAACYVEWHRPAREGSDDRHRRDMPPGPQVWTPQRRSGSGGWGWIPVIGRPALRRQGAAAFANRAAATRHHHTNSENSVIDVSADIVPMHA